MRQNAGPMLPTREWSFGMVRCVRITFSLLMKCWWQRPAHDRSRNITPFPKMPKIPKVAKIIKEGMNGRHIGGVLRYCGPKRPHVPKGQAKWHALRKGGQHRYLGKASLRTSYQCATNCAPPTYWRPPGNRLPAAGLLALPPAERWPRTCFGLVKTDACSGVTVVESLNN